MIAGIDAGSKFLKITLSNSDDSFFVEHHGNPEESFSQLIASERLSAGAYVFSGHYGEILASKYHAAVCDEVAASVASVQFYDLNVRHIVNVGSGSIRSIQLDAARKFHSYRENTLCAAGTGSFLDEQMRRMGFVYESLSAIPFIENPPDVATRCAVFAKSDLIHRQQEGFTREQMWNGLCRGVVLTMLNSAFRGDTPDDAILFCGGLFKNAIIREWVKLFVSKAVFLERGEFVVSDGALVIGKNGIGEKGIHSKHSQDNEKSESLKLEIHKSTVWKNDSEAYNENGNEIRIRRLPHSGEKISFGIDVGSTSTKMAVISSDRSVIIDLYRKTGGDPVDATKKLFESFSQIIDKTGALVYSCATTGSGRKLVGKLIGADIIVNEITAHFAGAAAESHDIETIFEIGGQDSKYIRGFAGNVADCNMNFVCAAGTGSFIEEQASRLGFDVSEIGGIVQGLSTPNTSDRCTVFMEQDINRLLREGYSREEVLAGVIYSIAKNYLARVVGARPVTGDRIFFQGATARNNGLVAAFEKLTGKAIIVSPNCHVMGAWGAALISYDKLSKPTSFKGFDVFAKPIDIRYTTCSQCLNKCTITVVKTFDGETASWGYKCGKENPEALTRTTEDNFKKITSMTESLSGKPKKYFRGLIGLPRALSMFNYLPLWRTFLEELGFEVKVTGVSTKKDKEKGVKISKSDFCFPVKIALAHSHSLSEEETIDGIFFPTVISEKLQKKGMPRVFCPYVITYPSVVKNSLRLAKPVIAPSIDFRFSFKRMTSELYESLVQFGVSRREVNRAYKKALEAQKLFLKTRHEEGNRVIERISRDKTTGIVLIGRPYNLYDRVLNLGLTEYFKSIKGIEAFPFEMMIDPEKNDSDLQHMYWNYGERILHAAEKIKTLENVYPVYFTNFGCGPDSFILSRFEKIMKGKPYLIIELDEHGSDTGYQTRIEAFIDVVQSRGKKDISLKAEKEIFYSFWDKRDRKLWIPPIHETSTALFAAGFRAYGYDAEALPGETRDAYELGKRVVRGSECLPASTTIGAFVKKMKEIDADPMKQAFLMATAEGPCRFGQYMVLHRNILDTNGLGGVEIFAPTSTNSYMGMPSSLRAYLWDVITAGDFVFKYICHRRPYEIEKGSVDKAASKAFDAMVQGIEKKQELIPLMRQALCSISKVPVRNETRPLVGIVGEIYVRSNPFCNGNLIRYIEENGGEAWLSPVSEWFIYTAWMEKYFSRLYDKNFVQRQIVSLKTNYLFKRLHKFEEAAKPYCNDRIEPDVESVLEIGEKYIPLIFEGETILTVARSIMFLDHGASLVVNCSPFGCMPGNIVSSVMQKMQRKDGKSVLSLFYDGESEMNRIVKVYLNNLRG